MTSEKRIASKLAGRLAAATLAVALTSGTAFGATVSYMLNRSDRLPDGTDYLQVTLSDNANGDIDVTVQALSPLTDGAHTDFSITKFGFNLLPDSFAEAADVTNLPDDWTARDRGVGHGFGRFDVVLKAGYDSAETGTLTFSIGGIDGDTVDDYYSLSTGRASEGHSHFFAQVNGFDFQNTNWHKATFGDGPAAPIPLPATGWLFGATCLVVSRLIRFRKQVRAD